MRNERIKLLATALNNLGVGAILTGIVAPVVNGTVSDLKHVILWCVLGVNLVTMAQVVLGRMQG